VVRSKKKIEKKSAASLIMGQIGSILFTCLLQFYIYIYFINQEEGGGGADRDPPVPITPPGGGGPF
jgi:hypothetical protein